jgi:hypothetical protein
MDAAVARVRLLRQQGLTARFINEHVRALSFCSYLLTVLCVTAAVVVAVAAVLAAAAVAVVLKPAAVLQQRGCVAMQV